MDAQAQFFALVSVLEGPGSVQLLAEVTGFRAIFAMQKLCSVANGVKPPNLGHIGQHTVIRCFCLSNTINLE